MKTKRPLKLRAIAKPNVYAVIGGNLYRNGRRVRRLQPR